MNPSVALPRPSIIAAGLNDLLSLVGLPSKRKSAAADLSGSAQELLNGISSVLDGLLQQTIAAQSPQEFKSLRKSIFPIYANAVISLAKLAKIVVPEPVMDRVLRESFCEIEAEFREHGQDRFGSPAKEQAMFTIWTLRRTSRIISKVVQAGQLADELLEEDHQLARDFTYFTVSAQFHLDCLLAAMRFNKPVQLDVLPEVIDGLRGAVNAYGIARQGLRLRETKIEPQTDPYQWDEEDQELLDSSMRDMELEALDD